MATSKEKIIERLTDKIKGREILGVKRDNPDCTWFHLIVDGKEEISVYDEHCTWDVTEDAEKITADLEQTKDNFGNESWKVIIKGNKEKIDNLLFNLGMGLPNERVKPYWKKENEDFA